MAIYARESAPINICIQPVPETLARLDTNKAELTASCVAFNIGQILDGISRTKMRLWIKRAKDTSF